MHLMLGEGNETTSHQSNHLSRTNESKHDKHSYEEGKVPDHQLFLINDYFDVMSFRYLHLMIHLNPVVGH
jgi:hypothetical protein